MSSPTLAVVFTALALPFLAAATVPLVYRLLGERTGYVGALVALVCFVLLGSQFDRTGRLELAWIPALDVDFTLYVDGWGLLFALLATGIGVLIFAYSPSYMRGEDRLVRYYAALLGFMGSIVGVALAADLIVLFVFWELTSVCSFLLIGYHANDAASRSAARMAMVVTVGGGLVLLVAIVLLGLVSSGVGIGANGVDDVSGAGGTGGADSATAGGVDGVGTFDLTAMIANAAEMQTALDDAGLFLPVLLLLAVAAGAKSAQVPLHFWLPGAMAAPTPVSAFLHSATMVKVGVYLVGRVRPLFESPEWLVVFTTVGLATMAITAALAVAAPDLKSLLAYSTASHLGLMIAAFGFTDAAVVGTDVTLQTTAAGAGVFHLFNHAVFKAALFLVAGIVIQQAGSQRLDELGGLRGLLPVTALIAAIAGLAMAGVPPFSGFYSKELLFAVSFDAAATIGGVAWILPVVAVLASVFTVLYSLRFLAIFVGDVPGGLGSVRRPSAGLLAPAAVLAGIAAVTAVAPNLVVETLLGGAITATGGDAAAMPSVVPSSLSPAVWMTAVTLAGGVAAYPFVDRIRACIDRAVATRAAVRPSWWYIHGLAWLEDASGRATVAIHAGGLRSYSTWLVLAASGFGLAGFLVVGARVPTPEIAGLETTLPIAFVLAIGVVAAVSVTTTDSHLVGVLALTLLGLVLAIFYILASGPDLALTQLVVETLALVIFLLVLEQLPEFTADAKRRVLVRDGLVAATVGVTVAIAVLVATAEREVGETATARYYTEAAYEEGGGTNVVNIVLVDFRAADTLGELVVIAIAGLAVLVLVAQRRRGDDE